MQLPLSAESSQRLSLLRFPLIVGVVFVHNYETSVGFQGASTGLAHGSAWLDFLRDLVSQGLARTAVPLFFLMSGYLFFWGFRLGWQSFSAKLRSRVGTLLVPFLFWNLLTLAIIATAQALPATASLMSGRNAHIAAFGPGDYVAAILGVGHDPISYQFWFIRDLMVLVLASPLVYLGCRYLGVPLLLGLLFMWADEYWLVMVPCPEATLFFALGCWLAQRHFDIFAADRWGPAMALAYIPAAVADALTRNDTMLNMGIHKLAVLLGVGTALWLSAVAMRHAWLRERLLRLAGLSFLVFAMHEPLLMTFRKIAFRLVQPQSAFPLLVLYLAIPVFVIALIVWLQPRMQALAPRFTALVSGGR